MPASDGKNPKPYRGRPANSHSPKHGKKNYCCPMVAAVGATRRGQFRLARRYAAMSVRLIAARVA